jgi:chromosome segregation ATPase
MQLDYNKIADTYTDNLFPFVKTLAGIALAGFALDLVFDMSATPFDGASVIFAYVAYIPYVMYKAIRADADLKKYDNEDIQEAFNSASAKVGEVTVQRDKCVRLAGAWKEKADALNKNADAINTECVRLRKSEQTLLEKLHTLKEEIANATNMIADEKAHGEKLAASAGRDARKRLLLPAELGTVYAEHRKFKSVYNNRSLSDEARGVAKAEMDTLKTQLDGAFANFIKA